MRNDVRNYVLVIQNQTISFTFLEVHASHLNSYQMLRIKKSNVEKIYFKFIFEINDLEKTSRISNWRRNIASSIDYYRHSNYIKSINISRRRLHHRCWWFQESLIIKKKWTTRINFFCIACINTNATMLMFYI